VRMRNQNVRDSELAFLYHLNEQTQKLRLCLCLAVPCFHEHPCIPTTHDVAVSPTQSILVSITPVHVDDVGIELLYATLIT
jgi:hypothetical protein